MSDQFKTRFQNLILSAEELPSSTIVHSIADMRIIYMNKFGLDELGTTLESILQLDNEQYHELYFDAEESKHYVPRIVKLIKSKDDTNTVSYFQKVINAKGEWHLYLSNSKVFARDENGDATHMITIANKVDPLHEFTVKISRVMDDLNFFRQNNRLFSTLTKREKQILQRMAMGRNSVEIANELFISSTTVDTHRRNVRIKLCIKNNYEIVQFAQAYNLV